MGTNVKQLLLLCRVRLYYNSRHWESQGIHNYVNLNMIRTMSNYLVLLGPLLVPTEELVPPNPALGSSLLSQCFLSFCHGWSDLINQATISSSVVSLPDSAVPVLGWFRKWALAFGLPLLSFFPLLVGRWWFKWVCPGVTMFAWGSMRHSGLYYYFSAFSTMDFHVDTLSTAYCPNVEFVSNYGCWS
jgi:hypothetical protein